MAQRVRNELNKRTVDDGRSLATDHPSTGNQTGPWGGIFEVKDTGLGVGVRFA